MPRNAGPGVLSQMGALYLSARWYLGVGLVLIPIVFTASGRGATSVWVLAVSGSFILAHAFALHQWRLDNVMSTLFIDLTAVHLSIWVLAANGADRASVLLAMVGAAVLVTLFTEGWLRVMGLVYTNGFGLVTLLSLADWDPSMVLGDFVGVLFVVAVVVGVLAAFRVRLIQLEVARAMTIGIVTHELRNHLAGVIGVTQILGDNSTRFEPGEVAELLDMAHGQATEAVGVIEDLLSASRSERGVLDARPEPCDIGPLTEQLVERFSVDDQKVAVVGASAPTWAMVDPLRYGQILRNLLINAVRYGGSQIRVSIDRMDGYVSVVVADNGDGVDPRDVPSLFQPYRRSKHRAPAPGSTGLGLWIARNLARGMGGDLTYRRHSDLTLFELTLAVASNPQTSPTPSKPADAGRV